MLLDTSGLFAFLHQPEAEHAKAVEYFQAATIRVTHSYVIAELIALGHARKLPRRQVLEFVDMIQRNEAVEVVYVNELLHLSAFQLLEARLDKDWSLCDAVSMQLMGELNLRDALTSDHHFTQAGYTALLR